MICYRDMTFCSAECANFNCQIKLTPKVQADAARWWGNENAPIALSDFSKNCDIYVPISKSVIKRIKVQSDI